MSAYALECHNVSFTYWGSTKPAIQEIDLCIEQGQFVVLLGPAGAGKSTFLLTLNGLIPHVIPGKLEGQVIIDGQDTKTARVSHLSTSVGLIFEDPDTQIVSLTVEDDIAFGPSNLGLAPEEIRKRVRAAIAQCRLSGFEERNPFTLSGGEKQSLAIAGILAMRPKILALDEPTSMLDPLGRAQVVSILKSLAQGTGTTIIIAEQNPELILELADRILIFDGGRIVGDGTPEEVFRQPAVLASVGVKLPPMVDLFWRLHQRGHLLNCYPLSVEQAAQILRPQLGNFSPPTLQSLAPNSEIEQGESVIQLRQVHHRYDGSVEALRGVNLDLYPNQLTAIVGQNGSGKTTLAYHLVGIRKPTNPDAMITVAALDVLHTPLRKLLPHINYVFQNPDDQIFRETVALEIAYGLTNLGIPEWERAERVERALDLLRLQSVKDQSPKALDRGLRTRTAIASVLAMQPSILIIDEPTTGLDRSQSLEIFGILEQLAQQGRTMIFISHEMDLVAQFAQRVVVMHKGQVLLDGPPAFVFSQEETLRQASLAPPEIHRLCRQLQWPLWDGLRTTNDLAQVIASQLERKPTYGSL